MRGASFSILVRDLRSGETCFAYDTLRQLTPASVMKTVTTATALELLGEDYRFATSLSYDGSLDDGVLRGNLYIEGGGDPSLGSSHLLSERARFMEDWIAALRKAGIRSVEGAVVSDESLFDTEGISPKWVREDLGNYYGAGSYGISVFDNLYRLILRTGATGSRPKLLGTEPEIPGIRFHDYLTVGAVASDSSYIWGAPFASDRYLYGVVPANRERYVLKGDIPDPALFLAGYLTSGLEKAGIRVSGQPTCHRLLKEAGRWKPGKRTTIVTTYSPPLRELVRITNHASHNLFADALMKTIGLRYHPRKGEVISSFDRGIRVLRAYWEKRGLDLSSVWMYDGSGLAAMNKLSTAFVVDLLSYMKNGSSNRTAFSTSLPKVGVAGSVRNFLKGSALQGKASLKSGSMSRVKGYAGYVETGGHSYAVALFVNNYACDGREMTRLIERLLLGLFD